MPRNTYCYCPVAILYVELGILWEVQIPFPEKNCQKSLVGCFTAMLYKAHYPHYRLFNLFHIDQLRI